MLKKFVGPVFFAVVIETPAGLMTHASCSAELNGVSQALDQTGRDSSTAHCSASVAGSGSRFGEADAIGGYGGVQATAFAFLLSSSFDIPGSSGASASAAFEDTLKIVGSGMGFIRATLDFFTDGRAGVNFSVAGYPAHLLEQQLPGGLDSGGRLEVDIPVEFGAALAVSGSVRASAFAFSDPEFGIASFNMVEMFILGPDKIPLSDARYVAVSNADYTFINAERIQVPEPGTTGLVFLGCSAAWLGRMFCANRPRRKANH